VRHLRQWLLRSAVRGRRTSPISGRCTRPSAQLGQVVLAKGKLRTTVSKRQARVPGACTPTITNVRLPDHDDEAWSLSGREHGTRNWSPWAHDHLCPRHQRSSCRPVRDCSGLPRCCRYMVERSTQAIQGVVCHQVHARVHTVSSPNACSSSKVCAFSCSVSSSVYGKFRLSRMARFCGRERCLARMTRCCCCSTFLGEPNFQNHQSAPVWAFTGYTAMCGISRKGTIAVTPPDTNGRCVTR